jgi:dihydroxyacetone kinase-like protein
VLRAAAEGARAGAASTVPLAAFKGRASYLGERSIGTEDPGARSTALLLAAAVVAAERPGAPEQAPGPVDGPVAGGGS